MVAQQIEKCTANRRNDIGSVSRGQLEVMDTAATGDKNVQYIKQIRFHTGVGNPRLFSPSAVAVQYSVVHIFCERWT